MLQLRSVLEGLGKDKKKDKDKAKEKDKQKLNQTTEAVDKKGDDGQSKAKLKSLIEGDKEVPKDEKKSKNKTDAVKPTTVYFDKDRLQTNFNDGLDRESDEERTQPTKPDKKKKEEKNGLKIIGNKKQPEDEDSKPELNPISNPKEDRPGKNEKISLHKSSEDEQPNKGKLAEKKKDLAFYPKMQKEESPDEDERHEKQAKKGVKAKKEVEKTLQFHSIEEPTDPYRRDAHKAMRPTERTQEATEAYYKERISVLEKQNNELTAEKEQLSLKVTKLTQSVGTKQKEIKELRAQAEEKAASSPVATGKKNRDSVDAVKELEAKLAQAEKQRGMELLQHESVRNKYDELKAKMEEQRNRMRQQMSNLEEQYKLGLKSIKDELSEARIRLQKAEKEKKDYDKERSAYRKEMEAKNTERKALEEKIKEMVDELTRKKMQISEAMNSASEMQDEKLTSFMENHFI